MKYTFKQIDSVRKETEYWTRKILQPIIAVFVWIIANFTHITPNFISFVIPFIGILSANSFALNYPYIGALLFLLMIILDGVDGALARVKYKETKVGIFLDNWYGNLGYFAVMFGLLVYVRASWALLSLVIVLFMLGFTKSWMSVHFVNIMNEGYQFQKKTAKKKKINDNTIFDKIKAVLLKYRIREPFSEKDMMILAIVIGAFTDLNICLALACSGLTINFFMWSIYYIIVLEAADDKIKKTNR